MKQHIRVIFSIAALSFLATTNVPAETEKKMVIALNADDFELTKTDVSSLAVGESQTIETDSGKVIDILRTTDGVELYVDGELMDLDFDRHDKHDNHMVQKHVEVNCENDTECDKHVFVYTGDDSDVSAWVSDEGDYEMMHDDIEISCDIDDGDDSSCENKFVMISGHDGIDLEDLHEMHANGSEHKIIVIKKEVISED